MKQRPHPCAIAAQLTLLLKPAARGVAVAAAPAALFPAEGEWPKTPPGKKPPKRKGRPPPLDPPCISKRYRPFDVGRYQVPALPIIVLVP